MNRLTMGQFSKVILAIDNVHTVPQRAFFAYKLVVHV